MNNDQFRRLLQENDSKQKDKDSRGSGSPGRDGRSSTGDATSTLGMALGSRQRANIPMTPYVSFRISILGYLFFLLS